MSLTLLYPVRLPPLLGRVGVGLLELLEPADPEPRVAVDAAHVDAGTVEVQGVRETAGPWVST